MCPRGRQTIGIHLSIAGGLHRAIESARRLRVGAVQIFLKNTNQWRSRLYTEEEIARFTAARNAAPDLAIFAHAGYLINIAGSGEVRRKSIAALRDELERAALLGISSLVLHPGSHGGRGIDYGVAAAAAAIDAALSRTRRVAILLETTAGQGASIGHRFEHLRAIIDASSHKRRLGVCLDTCHVFAAGYDLSDEEGYESAIRAFDRVIGLSRLKLIHLNDSARPCGSMVDRHEHIGRGMIGCAGFRRLLHDSRLAAIPVILETPKFDNDKADRINLARVRRMLALHEK